MSKHKELVKEHERLVRVLESPTKEDDKEEAKKQRQELKDLKAGKEYKPVNKHLELTQELMKALKAAYAASLAKKADAPSAGPGEAIEGPGPIVARPLHEPQAAPMYRITNPNPVPAQKCGDHTYKTRTGGPEEAKPFHLR